MRIEGFFNNIKNARNTVEQLRKEGFKAYYDINDHYISDRNIERNLAGTETGPSLSDLTLNSGEETLIDRSKAPLTAADPMVSGMGGIDEVTNVNCKVVVDIESSNQDRAKQIIDDNGGSLNNPNIKTPQIKGDLDDILERAIDNIRKNI
ncbi:hypothetical protein [Thermohalobacter berrensis]|uniref:Uncharacterized protein n=1 Tax=Thermohalobacter berrensis TaxID=99594 RepID=A0A419T2V2_9FIRM|nr:hypothetical protein [Thermohalobacter berrensis]RKD31781.1 hypothetical protein BET03_11905 [Thermohalobacter berrensis]